jgi:crossover junction endodeoxyribonuclease RuvC
MKVLGIDPSLNSSGYGIIEYTSNHYQVIAYGTIRPSRKLNLMQKIFETKNQLEEVIKTHSPDEAAIENPFFSRNIKTALILGQVRGAALIAVASCRIPLSEYSPLEIKKSVTGYGQAEKSQVQHMVVTLLNLGQQPLPTDASDALATAYCHINHRLFQQHLEN